MPDLQQEIEALPFITRYTEGQWIKREAVLAILARNAPKIEEWRGPKRCEKCGRVFTLVELETIRINPHMGNGVWCSGILVPYERRGASKDDMSGPDSPVADSSDGYKQDYDDDADADENEEVTP